jgi:signal transduction histidine kinase
VARPEDGQVRLMAIAERDPERARRWKERFPFPLTREYMHGVAILDCRMVDMPDVEQMDERFAAGKRNFAESGYRAMTVVPMVRDGAAIGTIAVVRDAAGPLSDKQIALLQTFADQAVIAIENVRLFNETREALEQQKASAEVLGAISSSIADTAPVFDKILESCERLFEGRIVGLNLVGTDGMLHIGAYHGAHREEFERIFPIPVTSESGSGLSIVERRVVHYPDTERGEGVPAKTRQGCRAIGIKSAIFAPMLWEGRGMGAIFVGRDHVSSFSEKEIALLKIFADQAAIAIENVRLFNEIQEKSRQLEVASRHKSEFLANMSHELRTPLNAIIGFTRIVMRRSQDKLEPQQVENLEKILASGQHLLALINSILDLAKVEAGRIEVNPGEIALLLVLEHCARTVEPLVKADAVTLLKEFDGALPQMVADEEKLRQIVINLLSNAAKFTARGSIRLQAHASNGSVAIAVADTGIGIAPDKLEVIFEEFAQADASSTRVYGGTGLGLTIARRLARLMGGEITAESVLGSGSKFTLTLPLRYVSPGA